MWRIEFSTDKFLPVLPEECQSNPGAYGFELAYWLAQALYKQGVITSYPVEEDWGWLIEHTDSFDNEYTIGCSSAAAYNDGYRNQSVQWSIFIRPYISLRERFSGNTRKKQVAQLGLCVVSALREEMIEISSHVA